MEGNINYETRGLLQECFIKILHIASVLELDFITLLSDVSAVVGTEKMINVWKIPKEIIDQLPKD